MSDLYADVSDHSDTEYEEDNIYEAHDIDEASYPDIIPKSKSLRKRLEFGTASIPTQDDDEDEDDDDDDDDERGDYVEINEDELPDLDKVLKANKKEVELPQAVKKVKTSFSFRGLFVSLKSKVIKRRNNEPEVAIGSPVLVANHPRSVVHSKRIGSRKEGGKGGSTRDDPEVHVGADGGRENKDFERRDLRPEQKLPDEDELSTDVIYDDAYADHEFNTGNKEDTESSDGDYEEPVKQEEQKQTSPQTHQRKAQDSEKHVTSEDEYIHAKKNDNTADEDQSRISQLYYYGSDGDQSRISDLYDDARSWVNPSTPTISPRLPDIGADRDNRDKAPERAPTLYPKPADICAKQGINTRETTDNDNPSAPKTSPRLVDIGADCDNWDNKSERTPNVYREPADICAKRVNNVKMTTEDDPPKVSPRPVDFGAVYHSRDNERAPKVNRKHGDDYAKRGENEMVTTDYPSPEVSTILVDIGEQNPEQAPELFRKHADICAKRRDNVMVTTKDVNPPSPKISPRRLDITADCDIGKNEPEHAPKVYRKPADKCAKRGGNAMITTDDENTSKPNAVQYGYPVKRNKQGNEGTVTSGNTGKETATEHDITVTESEQTQAEIQNDDADEVKELTIAEVCDVLRTLRMDKYVAVFEEEAISGTILADLTKDEFVNDLGMRGLDAIKLMAFIQNGHIPK